MYIGKNDIVVKTSFWSLFSHNVKGDPNISWVGIAITWYVGYIAPFAKLKVIILVKFSHGVVLICRGLGFCYLVHIYQVGNRLQEIRP